MNSNAAPLVIGLAGLGTVGTGLVQVLANNKDLIRERTGRDIRIKKILVRNPAKARPVPLPDGGEVVTDAAQLTDDPEISVIVELMGGIDAPRALMLRAMENDKHLVTANKALLAEKGTELFRKAAERHLVLLFEAAVAGAIPVVQTLKESLAGNRIDSLVGILNGTSNYILSEMTTNGLDFATALRQAQEQGFAEADPTLDIDGLDAAHKLVLLIRLACGVEYPFAKLPVQGIRGLSPLDIEFAREFGYRIKLLGQVRRVGEALEAGVFPTLVRHSYLLARVGGAYNAVRIEGNALGPLFLHGKGAGALPTASAVMGDLISLARGVGPNNTGFVRQVLEPCTILPPGTERSGYYVRVMVDDAPGVLRDMAGAMAAEGVSIAQVIQKSGKGHDGVPLVFMTHAASAKALHAALSQVQHAGLLREPAVCFRVLA